MKRNFLTTYDMIKINPMLIPGLKQKKSLDSLKTTKESIVKAVADEYGVGYKQVFSKRRHRSLVIVRQVSMLLIREIDPRITVTTLGKYFGDRDHTTVVYSLKTIQDLMTVDPELRERISKIRTRL